MEFWNEIVHTAMLGTGKKTPDISSLPPKIAELARHIQQQPLDVEDQYLQIAALALNYRQCGVAAVPTQHATIEKAAPETLPCCNAQSMQVLNPILDSGSISLLQLWLNACIDRRQIVQPDVIPALLEMAVRHQTIRTAVATCCGNRSRWLSLYHPVWATVVGGSIATGEEAWQTGTLEQRVQALQQLRTTNPALALQWLQQTWPQEDAATKTEMLPVLQNNISKADLAFLEGLLTEKSKKVKEAAVELIRFIPESAIVQLYWQVLKKSIHLTTEKALLGLATKKKVNIQLPETIDEQVFTSGIEKLSKTAKGLSDDNFILYQLTGHVPPDWWESYFGENKEKILDIFGKDDQARKLIPALGLSAVRFKNIPWLQAIIAISKNEFYPEALKLLPDAEQETYALQVLNDSKEGTETVLHYLTRSPGNKEWSLELTKKVLQHMMKDPWRYTKDFFNQHIHLLPVSILPELNKYVPEVEYQRNYWNTTTTHLTNLLRLKQQI